MGATGNPFKQFHYIAGLGLQGDVPRGHLPAARALRQPHEHHPEGLQVCQNW